ncbi:MAG: prepilin-type N-terminal cleavage/methylation domain-containing protein [Nitrospirae bacterium]|nr:prepilin-type N-terminal cleavage/methylation domain-containing protein [Nitrospirota bacterium]
MRNENNGFTLIEVLVVIAIIGIIVVAFGFSFNNWIGKYRVESQIKEMYTDLMNARARAMERNRTHFIANTNSTYSIYEDTNPAPDGNGTLETGTGGDTMLPTFPKTVKYNFDWDGIGGEGTTILINKKGIINPVGDIFIDENDPAKESIKNSDYNCIKLFSTKIYMGKKNEQNSACEIK